MKCPLFKSECVMNRCAWWITGSENHGCAIWILAMVILERER